MPSFQDVIDLARVPLNDADKVRYPDPEMFDYALDGLREMCLIRPDLFAVTKPVTCAAGAEQVLPNNGWFVIDVLGIVGGKDITESDYETMRAWNPAWRTATAGPALSWMRFPWDKTKGPNNRFYVSPPALAGQQLNAIWAEFDASAYEIGDGVPLPEQYAPALEAYLVARAEAKDDEHVSTARMSAFLQMFQQALGVGAQSEQPK